MLDPRSVEIEYASQLAFVTQLETLLTSKKLGKTKEKTWDKLDCVALYLQTVGSKDLLSDEQITDLTYIYNCLIKTLKLNRFPAVPNGVTVTVPPTVAVQGPQGEQGIPGVKGDTGGGKDF